MSNLFEDVQKQVEDMTQKLSGDEDFMPMMIVKDHRDRVLCIGLVWPSEDEGEGKDTVAASMAAICALYRAKEAAFTSVAWAVMGGPGKKIPTGSLEKCEDRMEVVMLNAMNADGGSASFIASLVRENNMVGVGLWQDMNEGGLTASGRFLEAMEVGIKMGQQIPPDMGAYLDEEIDANREGRLVHTMTQMYQKYVTEPRRVARKAAQN